VPEITRYNRGDTSYTPIVESPQGELVLAKDALPLVSEVERLEGVVKDLNAAVEDFTRILADKNGLIDSAIATCDECDRELQIVKKWSFLWRWLDVLLVGIILVQIGTIKGWW